ncbi:hypothetical protein [Mycolicibacterium porcinum]|uniref:Uncharacterized protein n=1 Tax=Mycolicibacterium porcinum TaxID=39693 RepID=A0ABV3VIY6_9MYCO
MNTWTVTTNTAHTTRTIIGNAPTVELAEHDMVIATGSLMERGGDHHSQYVLSVEEDLVAIIGTGADANGCVDHAGAAAMLAHLHHAVSDPYDQS